MQMIQISELVGRTFSSVDYDQESRVLTFTSGDNGPTVYMEHLQDCCENVYLEDIGGDLFDLEGSEILRAEENSEEGEDDYGTHTWTFYRIDTRRGSVCLRWFGESNGYYSEDVSLHLGRDY